MTRDAPPNPTSSTQAVRVVDRRRPTSAVAAGVLAAVLAAPFLAVGGLVAAVFVWAAAGGTFGGYGAGAEDPTAWWYGLAQATVFVAAVIADLGLGWAVARATRKGQRRRHT